jgi:branched-chain amino acid transport system permease protein
MKSIIIRKIHLKKITYRLIIVAGLLSLYFILPSKMMPSEILIMAMPTLGFILLLGYVGLLSFGMGSLFATGAYASGILLTQYQCNILLTILLGVVITGIISAVVGYFCIKRAGLIFALLTLAFNQLIWFTIYKWKSLLGGPDGIIGIYRSTLSLGLFTINLRPTLNYYIFVLIIFLSLMAFLMRLIESPFGKILLAIRDNKLRAKAIGYNPETYQWITFLISGMTCGLGGSLFAIHQEYVGVHLASWVMSGEIIIMGLIGGISFLYGGFVGSGVYIFASDFFNTFSILARTGGSLLLMGIIFILMVIFFRDGIYGEFIKIYRLLKVRS